MEKLDIRLIKKEAGRKLPGRASTRLAAIHTGAFVALALVSTVLNYLLAEGIGNTGGLSGMGTRSVLETIQTVLQWANTLLVPFWNLGFLYMSLQWAQSRHAQTKDLLMGFRRTGPCLGLFLNRMLLSMLVMILCAQLSSTVYMLTPAAERVSEMVSAAGTDMDAVYTFMEQMSTEQAGELMGALAPALIIWGILCLVILVPLMYRFRMAEFVILDTYGARGLSSMLISASLLRRRCWQLFRLDLQLWWYYGLKVLCMVLCYADLLLELMGIVLPFGSDGTYFASYLLYLAAIFAVETCFRPRVATVYACAYRAWKEMGPAAKKAMPQPTNMPWDEE